MLTAIDDLISINVLFKIEYVSKLLITLCNLSCIRLESCNSTTYWSKTMPKSSAQKVLPKQRYTEEEGWEYIKKGTLKLSCTARVCMTCVHFRYACDHHCHTLLTCTAHYRLIPQGAHLNHKCPLWHKTYEDKYGFRPNAA